MKKPKVHMYLDHVRATVKVATEESLYKVGLQIEGIAKRNITTNDQVDTGFMLNTVYTISDARDTFGATWDERPGSEGKNLKTEPPNLRGRYGEVAVVVGAVYAIFQEVKHAFLRPAVQEVVGRVGGTMEAVFKRVMHD